MTAAALESVVLLACAVAAHWLLRRASLRLPRRLGRRHAERGGTGRAPWVRAIGLALLAAKVAVWVAVLWLLGRRVHAVAAVRDALGFAVEMSLVTPLFTMSGRTYTAVDLLLLPALVALAWLGASLLTRLLRAHVLDAAGVEPGAQEAAATVVRLLLAFVGSLVVLQTWGVDVRSLALVASVLGVGIGFGLQHLASNFVSGLVLALERPIRPGDFVRVGDSLGTVQRIGSRSTIVQTPQNVTILVPNSRFLETEVVNWSHGSPVSKIEIPVGVSYRSDLRVVRTAMLEAAKGHSSVLREPRPEADFRRFGDSAIEMELEVWTAEPQHQEQLVSDLGYRIVEAFRRHGVEIPFPQRDLHLRSPALDRVVDAVGRRLGAEPAPPPPAVATMAPGAHDGMEPALPEASPPEWSAAELGRLAARMQGPHGVGIEDRRHLLSLYRRCFVGSEAVDWIVRTTELTRAEAVALGERLVEHGLVRHVVDEHGFRDGRYFYRFVEPARAL